MRMFGFIRNDRPLLYDMRSRSDEVCTKTQRHNHSAQTYFWSHTARFQEGMNAKVHLRTGGRLVRELAPQRRSTKVETQTWRTPLPTPNLKKFDVACSLGQKLRISYFPHTHPWFFILQSNDIPTVCLLASGTFRVSLNSRWETIGKMHRVNLCINLKLGHWFRRQSYWFFQTIPRNVVVYVCLQQLLRMQINKWFGLLFRDDYTMSMV
jgi:hypothetical protein